MSEGQLFRFVDSRGLTGTAKETKQNPNDVRTTLIAHMVDENGDGNRLERLAELVTGDKGAFDFDKIVPRPADFFCGFQPSGEWQDTGGLNWRDWNKVELFITQSSTATTHGVLKLRGATRSQ